MTVHVLGISAFYHDASAAIISDGKLLAAASEERFTHLKHDSNFPRFAINYCLESAGIEAQDLDAVVFYEEPHIKFTRVLTSAISGFPKSRSFFCNAMKVWLGSRLWISKQISMDLSIDPSKVLMVPHHLSHAAQAFAGAPSEDSAILTVDAVGEWNCTAIAKGTRDSNTPIEILESISYPHSLGLVYAAFTGYLGFRPNDGEANIMALSAFGKPEYVNQIRQIIKIDSDGKYSIDESYFNFLTNGLDLFTSKFIDLFGPPRNSRTNLPFDCLDDHVGDISASDQRYADIAASMQYVLEEALLGLAKRAKKLTGSNNLCIAGGVALNCVAVSKIIDEVGFDQVYIPPDPGDGGSCIGAAWLKYSEIAKDYRSIHVTPFVGKAYPDEPSVTFLNSMDPTEWAEYAMDNTEPTKSLKVESYQSFDNLVEDIANEILSGNIVGWLQGGFEFGPRALGNRSILCDPQDLTAVKKLSKIVKKRAHFRPYALSIREEDVPIAFDFNGKIPLTARWMQMVKPVREEIRPLVRGGIHFDGTTRLQSCSKEENPKYHRLLSEIARYRKVGAIVNTSFNDSGFPIVSGPNDALITFARSSMDILVLNNVIVKKVFEHSEAENAEITNIMETKVGTTS